VLGDAGVTDVTEETVILEVAPHRPEVQGVPRDASGCFGHCNRKYVDLSNKKKDLTKKTDGILGIYGISWGFSS